jgi:NadR type nicotinamide-nucleotide adenylyltransferase
MDCIRIVITGAESTGKSTLAQALSSHFNAPWVPEFAREYVEFLDHHYTYSDVEKIALKQIEQEKEYSQNHALVFFDTWLIITKVWFDYVYGKHPVWLDGYLKNCNIDLFLVCDIDMEWIPDSVRENGGEARKQLHQIYINELQKYGFPYHIVNGLGKQRTQNAINLVNEWLISRNIPLVNHIR